MTAECGRVVTEGSPDVALHQPGGEGGTGSLGEVTGSHGLGSFFRSGSPARAKASVRDVWERYSFR